MVRGVDSEVLKKVKAQGLLGNEGLQNISEKMSCLQKKCLLVGVSIKYGIISQEKQVPNLRKFLVLNVGFVFIIF